MGSLKSPRAAAAFSEVTGGWKIDGCFDAEASVEISTSDDWVVAECVPITEDRMPEEIARVYAMHASPELLAAAKATVCLLTHEPGLCGSDRCARCHVEMAIAKATPPDFPSAAQDARPSGGPKA